MTSWCAACEEPRDGAPGEPCPICRELLTVEEEVSSAITQEVPTVDEEYEDVSTDPDVATIVADALDDQVWGRGGLDPVDEAAFVASLGILGRLPPEQIAAAIECSEAPEAPARRLMKRVDGDAVAAPVVKVDVLDRAGTRFVMRVLVIDKRPKRARAARIQVAVECVQEGVTAVVNGSTFAAPDGKGMAAFAFGVSAPPGSSKILGRVVVTLSRRGSAGLVYSAGFEAIVDDRAVNVVTTINNFDGVVRYVNEASAKEALAYRERLVLNNDHGRAHLSVPASSDVEVTNRGGQVRLARGQGRSGGRESTASRWRPLIPMPDLKATIAAAIAARVRELRDEEEDVVEAGATAHNAVLYRKTKGALHATVLSAGRVTTMGRHHEAADVPVRPSEDVSVRAISRQAVQLRWEGRRPAVKRIGASPVYLDASALTDRWSDLPDAGLVEWTRHVDLELRWKLAVTPTSGAAALRWIEPDVRESGELLGHVHHVVAPDGGALGGQHSLVALSRPAAVPVQLERRGRFWAVQGLAPGDGELLLDGRPARHPELLYGLEDGTEIRLPCQTRLRFRVARTKREHDWELRDDLKENGPEDLRALLRHVMHP